MPTEVLVLTDADVARFWSAVSLPDAEGCMLWRAGRTAAGYGLVRASGKPVYVHQVSLVLADGQRPEWADEAAHSCRNRHCAAPDHLRWATYQQNNLDKRRDGTDNRGDKHPLAKLTEEQVLEIRRLRPTTTGAVLADLFGVSQATICDIVKGRAWRHLG